jgi:hypothetical protein
MNLESIMRKPPIYKLEAWRPWHYIFEGNVSGASRVPIVEKELVLTRLVTTAILNAMYKRRITK